MRTTLVIADDLLRELKKRAAEEKRTLSDVTQEAIRRGLGPARPRRRARRVKLLSFSMGKAAVDMTDRNRLFELLDRS